MTGTWKMQSRLRVDPYLNWLARGAGSTKIVSEEHWCLVRIEVPEPPMPNSLATLAAALASRRLPQDGSGTEPTIVASSNEIDRLGELVDALKQGSGPPSLRATDRQFYVYRPEALLYEDGRFRTSELFVILQAGPPIPGFTPRQTRSTARNLSLLTATTDDRVAIGIIDDGIAFAHERFRTKSGQTRIEFMWIQDVGKTDEISDVMIGSVLTRSDIQTQLNSHRGSESDLYEAFARPASGQHPHRPLALRRSHGTFCLDVATGADPGQNVRNRPIFAVQLPADVVADSSGAGVASYVLQGVRQIIDWADAYASGIPLIINFSYGLLAGPKDGTHPLEQALQGLVEAREARGAQTRFVIAAGNSYNSRTNAHLEIKPGQSVTHDWIILPDDSTSNFVEIWFDGQDALVDPAAITVTLTPPSSRQAGDYPLDSKQDRILMEQDVPVAGICVDHNQGASGNRTRVVLSVAATQSFEADVTAPHGRWEIRIRNRTGSLLEARLYVQRDNTPSGYPRRGRQSYFDDRDAYDFDERTRNYTKPGEASSLDRSDTLSAIATGKGTVVVGAAKTTTEEQRFEPADYSASGPSRTRTNPDYSALADVGPGRQGILAAGTYSGSVVAMNGTSVAAPQVVRHLANQMRPTHVLIDAGAAEQPHPDTVDISDAEQQKRLGPVLIKPSSAAMRDKLRY
jgi:hypothetical protein